MKEKFAQMLETIKANKPLVIRVAGVTLGALIGVAVAALVVNAQEAEFESDDMLTIDEDVDDENE